jgi:hypothetical protein
MKHIDAFNAKYFPATGGIAWPPTPAERETLARQLFGLGFVAAHDRWIAQGRKIIDADGPALAPVFARETAIRSALADLNTARRAAVVDLVRVCVRGALFSALVSIDQLPRAELAIDVHDDAGAVAPIPIAPGDEELHDDFFQWPSAYSSEPAAAT